MPWPLKTFLRDHSQTFTWKSVASNHRVSRGFPIVVWLSDPPDSVTVTLPRTCRSGTAVVEKPGAPEVAESELFYNRGIPLVKSVQGTICHLEWSVWFRNVPLCARLCSKGRKLNTFSFSSDRSYRIEFDPVGSIVRSYSFWFDPTKCKIRSAV